MMKIFFQVTQDLESFTQMVSVVIFSEVLSMLDVCICHSGHHCFWRFEGRLRTFDSVWRVQLVC